MKKLILLLTILFTTLILSSCDLTIIPYEIYNETSYEAKIVNTSYKYTIPANSNMSVVGHMSYPFALDPDEENGPIKVYQVRQVVRIQLDN